MRRHRQIVMRLLKWFGREARDLPWRRTRNPYAIWVSEIMLQQTRVSTVLPYWEKWMKALPNLSALAKARTEKIHKLWEGLGYYSRVRNMQKAAQKIMDDHGGKFPREFSSVLDLPGIGRYTAGAICSIAFDQPTPILDGNVIRVLARLFGISGDPKEKPTNTELWQLAEELVAKAAQTGRSARANATKAVGAKSACSQLNQSLMELGALVCTPRQPRCEYCPLAKLCVAHAQNRVEELPNLSARTQPTKRRFLAFVAEEHGRFLVRQRPAKVVNAHLWEFPNVECALKDGNKNEAASKLFGAAPEKMESLCTIKHAITRYQITLDAFMVSGFSGGSTSIGVWLGRGQLSRLAFSSAHLKILAAIDNRQI